MPTGKGAREITTSSKPPVAPSPGTFTNRKSNLVSCNETRLKKIDDDDVGDDDDHHHHHHNDDNIDDDDADDCDDDFTEFLKISLDSKITRRSP